MLEVHVNRAHLRGSVICIEPTSILLQSSFNSWDFVRDLFTISRFAAFI